jgi:N-carbamoylputrescine amidase
MELTVGAIQMESRNQDVEGNLRRAIPLVEEAAGRGAILICLPEFLPCGYVYHERMWEAAERSAGPTTRWLAEQAKRLHVTLGTSFLEVRDEGFRNVFVLMGPDGEYGRVGKEDVAVYENWFTEGDPGPHVIQTPFARVGVGICYENLRAFLSPRLVEHDADILLQPHCCPMVAGLLPARVKRIFEDEVRHTAARYARGLGIPVVFVNQCGFLNTPIPMFPFLPFRAPFLGHTNIVDSDGTMLDQAEREPAVLVRRVNLDPQRKTHRPLPSRGKWVAQMPMPFLRAMEFIDARGKAAYARNPRRAVAARRMLGQ